MNNYEKYQAEKDRLFNQIPDTLKHKVEENIKKQLRKNRQKSMGQFFTLDDVLSIPEVKKYFSLIVITGDRNIGKSYAMKNLVSKNYIENGKRSMWVRTIAKSADEALVNDTIFWKEKGWSVRASNGDVVIPVNEKKAITSSNVADTVCWYRGLKTANTSKSISFPKTNLMIVDEFNDGIYLPDKLHKLASFASTVFRHEKGKIILAANFIDQGDNLLASLGMKQEKGRVPELTINWIIPAIIWNIPKGAYQKTGSTDLLPYKLAVAAGYVPYKTQYGGEFENHTAYNIKPISAFVDKKDICYFWVGHNKYVFGSSLKTGDCYIVDWEKRKPTELPEYVFCDEDLMRYKNARMVEEKMFINLKKGWKYEKIFTDEIGTAEVLIRILSKEVDLNDNVKIIKK